MTAVTSVPVSTPTSTLPVTFSSTFFRAAPELFFQTVAHDLDTVEEHGQAAKQLDDVKNTHTFTSVILFFDPSGPQYNYMHSRGKCTYVFFAKFLRFSAENLLGGAHFPVEPEAAGATEGSR